MGVSANCEEFILEYLPLSSFCTISRTSPTAIESWLEAGESNAYLTLACGLFDTAAGAAAGGGGGGGGARIDEAVEEADSFRACDAAPLTWTTGLFTAAGVGTGRGVAAAAGLGRDATFV